MKYLVTALLMLMSASGYAQSTYTAATCAYADVNTIVNGPTHTAINGDVIVIPAGSCTWTSELSITVGLTLEGTGTPNTGASTFGAGSMSTTIVENTGTTVPVIYVNGLTYGQTARVQSLNILPFTTSTALANPIWALGTCTSSGCPQLEIDNINFGTGTTLWTEAGNTYTAATMMAISNFYGVVDHNTLPSGSNVRLVDIHHPSWLGVGSYGDNSWAQADTLGTASAMYVENNSDTSSVLPMTDTEVAPGSSTANLGGGRIVARYNHVTFTGNGIAACYNHGTETTGRPRGGRQFECYNNTVTCLNSGGCQSTAGIRSGVPISFNNVNVSTSGNFNQYVNLLADRRAAGFAPWNFGDGLGPYDVNTGTTFASGAATGGSVTALVDSTKAWTTNQWQLSGAPYSMVDITQSCGSEILSNTATTLTIMQVFSSSCVPASGDSYEILQATVLIDQPSRGQGSYISGSTPTPTGSVGDALDPTYEFNDTTSTGSTYSDIVSDLGDLSLISNRDFYSQASGVQATATSPFNGTSGTGYGTLVNRPTTCTTGVGYGVASTGQLYTCTATNTWTLSYTPYTYPHPLTVTSAAIGSYLSSGTYLSEASIH